MQEQYVIIVAGGIGSRMKSDRPKQFIELDGVPIIVRTIQCFLRYNPDIKIIISIHADYKTYLEDVITQFGLSDKAIRITLGGDSRFMSVKNGLRLVDDEASVVGIHDAARPFVSQETIASCYATALKTGSAVPCVPVNESMRHVSNNANHAVNRNDYKIIQTPQCFLTSRIKKAFEQEYSAGFTDDATVLESTGEAIVLVKGNAENIKITSPHDLLIAQALLRS